MSANGKFGPELTQFYAAFYLMISSKDFLERFLNDKAQVVDKSNITLQKKIPPFDQMGNLCSPKFMPPYIS